MKALAAPVSAPFNARATDLKGDIYAAQGKTAEARSAYESAMTELGKQVDTAGQHGAYRALIQTKLESLAGPASKAAESK